MSFLLLHISDIHIKKDDDFLLDRAANIASTLNDKLPSVECVFVIVSGDIAYSGNIKEYELAKTFFRTIKDIILKQKDMPIYFIIVPGNHDCDFSMPLSVRDTLIKEITDKGETVIDNEKIAECVKVQKHFNKFRDELASENVTYNDDLWTCQVFGSDHKIVFMTVNASWMSQVKEKPGQLVFPIHKYKALKIPENALTFVVMHHPLNWYTQGTYHPLKQLTKSISDFIVSGHEHLQGVTETEDIFNSQCIFIEGGSVNPHDNSVKSSFNLMYFDMVERKYACEMYEWDGTIYNPKNLEKSWSNFRPLPEKKVNGFNLEPSFETLIMEAGANFSHPGKSSLSLPDFFINPHLKQIIEDKKPRKFSSSKELNEISCLENGIILRGQDKAGKTSLLFTLFRKYHSQKKIPLYINCSSISRTSVTELNKLVEGLVDYEYGLSNTVSYRQLHKDDKIILLDDFDRMLLNEKSRAQVLTYFVQRYKYVIITTGDIFDLKEMISPDTIEIIKAFKNYDIMPFGHVLRLELIRKWYNIGEYGLRPDVEQNYKIDQAEKIINTVLGKNLIPSVPIYLLALLQSIESGQNNRLENSAFGHYYNYLISDALKEISIRPEEWDEFYSYASHLAWEFNQLGKKELDVNELREFTKRFSDNIHTVDYSTRIKQLCDAKLITNKDGYYSFSYPYIYYFFLGKHLANHLSDPIVKAKVEHYCDHLYVSEYANSILFLTHFSKEQTIITRIIGLLSNLFSDKSPVNFDEDTVEFNELLDETSKLIIEDRDIYENRIEVNTIKDRTENDEIISVNKEEVEIGNLNELDLFSKINLLFKTIDIIGQILRSYYGSLPNVQKEAMLIEVFNAPLRALKDFIDFISEDKEALIKEVEGWIDKEGKKLPQRVLKEKARRGVFNSLGLFNFLFLYKTSNAIASKQLSGIINKVVNGNPTLSYKLIELGTKLELPGKMPIEDIKKLKLLTEGNIFARRLLETYVVHHLYMFKTEIRDKQKISELLDIQIGVQRSIDIKSQHQKRIG